MRSKSLKYADIFIKSAQRARRTPRVNRTWRTRKLLNLTAFFRNRFYDVDRWYKARIEKPITYPTMYTIDPTKFTLSLERRMLAESVKQSPSVNVGFAWQPPTTKTVQLDEATKGQLEKLALNLELLVDLEAVEADGEHVDQPERLKLIAEHFEIFKHLFDEFSYFYPIVPVQVAFDDQEALRTVHFGNLIKPAEAKRSPLVSISTDQQDSYWTLVLVNLDGNIYEDGKQVLHWMIGNIPGVDVKSGDRVCPYVQPLPLRGTGLHRFVFLLFKQTEQCDFGSISSTVLKNDYESRTFSLLEFYRHYEHKLTPAGMAFFQSEWDPSCSNCFHQELKMEEPSYAYKWPPPSVPPQKIIPDEPEPFNKYLDKYRDVQDVEAELLLKRLSKSSIGNGGPTKLAHPNIFYEEEKLTLPSWLHMEKYKENAGLGKYKTIYENSID